MPTKVKVLKEKMYKQCRMTKVVDGGTMYMMSWIREPLAVVGKVIDKLEDPETGRVEHGWKVVDAPGSALPEGMLIRQSRDYKKQRDASDI